MQTTLSKQQNMMVGSLLVTYALYYLGRVNISVVLPALALDQGVSRAEVGALGTVFFWVYGIFHFISGEIGSHVSPFRLVSLGLLASAIVNLVFAFQSSLIVMLILWGLNGVAQSGGWSPMFRILAERLDRSHIKRVSTIMPFSYVMGTAITWVLIGAAATGENWRIAFWLPGIILLLVLVFWRAAGIDAPKSRSDGIRLSTMMAEARGIAFVMLAAALSGYVFNGTIIWLPTYILDTGLIAEGLVGAVAALTQAVAILGLLTARALVTRSNQVFATAVRLFSAAGVAFLLLSITAGLFAIVVVAFALLALNGAFGLTVSAMPLLLAPAGRASSTTGAVNMMSTFFGGMAGFSIGGLVELSGWSAVFSLWGALLLLACLLIWRNRHIEAAKDSAL
ncbi:MAG: MFS transporter [Chloroflexi bacterium]|nr:MFS transporter [Chloroflexota bacterium]